MSDKVAELLLKVKTIGAESVDKLSESFDAIKQAGTIAFAAISAVVVKSIMDYKEQEEATNKLTQAMINNGIYSKALSSAYADQASALQKVSIFGDEQITNAQAILQGYLGQTQVSKELTRATLDLATAKKMDLASAAEMVGKSIGTSTNALARNGIEVTSNASQQQKLEEVLKALEGRYNGQAEAATKGLGSLVLLKNVVSDLFEEIGARLAPAVTYFTTKLIGLGRDTATTQPIIDAFVGSLKLATQVGVVVAAIFDQASKVISITLGTAIGTIVQLLDGQFKQAWETVKTGATDAVNSIPETIKTAYSRIEEIDKAFSANKEAARIEEEQKILESNSRKSIAAQEFEASEASKRMETMLANQQLEMQALEAGESQRAMAQLNARIKAQENIIKATASADKKLAAQNALFRLNEEKMQLISDQNMTNNKKDTFATIATLQNSSNKNLAIIGKAAALTQIAIATPEAVAKAYTLGPVAGPIAAGLVYTAMAAQAAQVAGIQLAEGGIVKARPGGVQATIGEGGQDEMVIPLDRASEFGLGSSGERVIINFNGPVMGDETQAREFAIAVDRQLLKLRQNNESVAFDTGVI